MKTQDEIRSEFEKLGNIKPVISACFFDYLIDEYTSSRLPEYSLGFVNGAWYSFQEQQKKIDAVLRFLSGYDSIDIENSVNLRYCVNEIEELLK